MKKMILASLTAAASLGAVAAPAASAANAKEPSPMYMHLGSTYATQAQCQSHADGRKASVKAAGGTLVTGDYAVEDGNCDLGTTGWTYSTAYTREAGPISGDVRVDDAGITDATATTIGARRVAYFTHEYSFANQADCVKSYNFAMGKLKSTPNTIKIVPEDLTGPVTPDQGVRNTFSCNDYGSSPKPWTYRITYQGHTDTKAPFGYESVETLPLDQIHANAYVGGVWSTHWKYEEGKTLADGTYKKTGEFYS